MQYVRTSVVLVLALAAPSSAFAEAAPSMAQDDRDDHDDLAVAVGAAYVDDPSEPSLSADLEVALSGHVGLVVLLDVARVHTATHLLTATGISVHPWGGLILTAAFGWEHAPDHRALALRAATGYGFSLGSAEVVPTLTLDRASGATAIDGAVTISLGF